MDKRIESYVHAVSHLTGKHIKTTLTKLEDLGKLDEVTRKVILDEFNSLARDLTKLAIPIEE